MSNSPLIFLIGGAVLLFLGLRGLHEKQVYLGRLIRFIGPKLVLRARLSVLLYGVLLSAGGVLCLIMGIAKLTDPESTLVDQIGPFAVYAFLGGFFGSMVVELIYYSSNMGPYGDIDPEDYAGNY
ncbi:MAG: hypothetical protein OXG53_00940 [Chloroflexi bacterium]|nr:hypothetical protein [Chloroflexota bacterium]